MSSVLIIGRGDVGRYVAAGERAAGEPVTALARSASSAARLGALGLQVVHGDLDDPGTLAVLPTREARVYLLRHHRPPARPIRACDIFSRPLRRMRCRRASS